MTHRQFRVAVRLNSGTGTAGYQYMECDEYEAAEQITDSLYNEGWDCHIECRNSELAAGWQIGDPSHNEHFVTEDGTHFGHGDWVWVYGYSGDLLVAQVDFLLEGSWRKFGPQSEPMPWLFYVRTKDGYMLVSAKDCMDYSPRYSSRAATIAEDEGKSYVSYVLAPA